MNTILLDPSDVLFFRDGRPMSGSLAGHGAAWPLPTVINHAFHAALHRADLEKAFGGKVHGHDHWSSAHTRGAKDVRKFGSLVSAGPFPVCTRGEAKTWFFPRPMDAADAGSPEASLLPLRDGPSSETSSLPAPLCYAVADTKSPTKAKAKRWLSEGALCQWAGTAPRDALAGRVFQKNDDDIGAHEHQIGIGMDPQTGAQDGERFYSASYLRLLPGWQLGVLAAADDKEFHHDKYGRDLVRALLNGHGAEIIAGGQQRVCSAKLDAGVGSRLPLPLGRRENFNPAETDWKGVMKKRFLVKWMLLTPAVWPEIEEGISRKRGTRVKAHPGGWLPNWICPITGTVLLQTITDEERRTRRQLNYDGSGYESQPNISARLVAAITGKPLAFSGHALPHAEAERAAPEPKQTHLAVPAGAVYYFEADSPEEATKLADALNWHGAHTSGTRLTNRRSTLFGAKGFGIGLCGTWNFHSGVRPATD